MVAWKLISIATSLCQDAGYHRLPEDYEHIETRHKRIAFWYVYALDKTLSFNFGRVANLQDYDITTSRPCHPRDIDGHWGKEFIAWLDLTQLKAEIYMQLYAGQAQAKNTSTKKPLAQELATRLRSIRVSYKNV